MISPFVSSMIDDLIKVEARYSNNPHDRGGETAWGITIAVARANGYTGAMKDMPRQVAVVIYIQRYWEEPGFDLLAFVDNKIAEELFEAGVNAGPTVPVKWLQRLLNALNQSHRPTGPTWPEVIVDGVAGRRTRDALSEFITYRGNEGRGVMLRALNAMQAAYYLSITESRERNEEFLYGWLRNRTGN